MNTCSHKVNFSEKRWFVTKVSLPLSDKKFCDNGTRKIKRIRQVQQRNLIVLQTHFVRGSENIERCKF